MMLDVCWLFVLIAYQLLVAVGHRVCGWKRKNERKTTFGVESVPIHSFIHLSHEIFERSLDPTDLQSFFCCFVLSQHNSEQSPPRNNVQNNAPHPIRRPSTQIYNEVAGALPSNQSSSP